MTCIVDPKTKCNGIICAIPQDDVCPIDCAECFFRYGRSCLEPLTKDLPNAPSPEAARGRVDRMNDGNDTIMTARRSSPPPTRSSAHSSAHQYYATSPSSKNGRPDGEPCRHDRYPSAPNQRSAAKPHVRTSKDEHLEPRSGPPRNRSSCRPPRPQAGARHPDFLVLLQGKRS